MDKINWLIKNWQEMAFIFGMIGSVQFVVLSFTAMIFYPGGYSFFTDPLSGLGFTQVAGESNFISSLLFNPSMFLIGLSVIILFPAMIPFFTESKIEEWFSLTGAIFAVLSGIAMCGAALIPGDINFEAHVAFAPFTFHFALLMALFYSIPMLLNKDFPNRYAFVLMIYAVFVTICLLLLYILGSAADTLEGSMIQITSQKAAIYAEMITLFVVSNGVWKLKRSQDLSLEAKSVH
ncbi:MAG: hypothetical protein ACFFC7_25015 [Candidatus Hermodarchaeota archaeon]